MRRYILDGTSRKERTVVEAGKEKKRMRKKHGIQIAGVLLAAALLTGCGAQTTEQSTEGTSSAPTEIQPTEPQSAESQAGEETDTEEAATDTAGDSAAETVSVAGWNITVEDVQKNTSLENVSVELGYTGVETSDYQKEADAGKTFCLIKLLIEKDGSKETIEWNKLKLTDGNGTEYTRMSDEFLTDLGMTRMTGNTLNFGSNEGWIAFEIDENAENLEQNQEWFWLKKRSQKQKVKCLQMML